jgi:hypothetical protein
VARSRESAFEIFLGFVGAEMDQIQVNITKKVTKKQRDAEC